MLTDFLCLCLPHFCGDGDEYLPALLSSILQSGHRPAMSHRLTDHECTQGTKQPVPRDRSMHHNPCWFSVQAPGHSKGRTAHPAKHQHPHGGAPAPLGWLVTEYQLWWRQSALVARQLPLYWLCHQPCNGSSHDRCLTSRTSSIAVYAVIGKPISLGCRKDPSSAAGRKTNMKSWYGRWYGMGLLENSKACKQLCSHISETVMIQPTSPGAVHL